MSKDLSLSIVIPVYNEEHYLGQCLDAIAAQSVRPDEVIVVDNNSTDNTLNIAKSYPFVRVMHEKRQGQTFAQELAFNNSSADIFARLDADTHLPERWVEKVKAIFDESPDTVAITGGGHPYDVPMKTIGRWIFRTYHERISRRLAGFVMLWGSNCALRAEVWAKIKHKTAKRADIWEDYELSFLLHPHGRIRYISHLNVGCSFRAAHKSFLTQVRYQVRAVRTFALYASWWRTALFTMSWLTLIILFPFPLIDRYIWKYQTRRKQHN